MNAENILPSRVLRRPKPITVKWDREADMIQPWHVRDTHGVDFCDKPSARSPLGGATVRASGEQVRCRPSPAFDAIVAEAKRVGWPVDYRGDLFQHDRDALAVVPAAVPFLWVLRESGTHLYLATPEDIDGARHKAWQVPSWMGTGCRFYTWDGFALRSHCDAEACADAVRELAENFDPKAWGSFAPPVRTRRH
jgi:hypothetical protein